MANLAKFGGGLEGKRMYDHWSRATDEKGDYITYAREEGGAGHIDRNRTALNYTIGEIHPHDWIAERLERVYQKPGQKKPIQSCDIVVTLPQSESQDPENINKFFKSAYNSLKKMYGKNNNIIGCWVHLDEAQPHMHFAFLPISERNSKQKPEFKEKLSTRAYWSSKSSLQDMHKTLQADIEKDLGRKIPSLYDGKTREQGGNKTVAELKAETAKEKERLEKLKTTPEELKELEGTNEKPWVGEEYYKLTPHQYKRLRTIARISLNEQAENESIRRENATLQAENQRLTKWMHYYLGKAQEEAEKELGAENKKIKGWLDELENEKAQLYKEIDELSLKAKGVEKLTAENSKMQKFIQSRGLEADFKRFGSNTKGRIHR